MNDYETTVVEPAVSPASSSALSSAQRAQPLIELIAVTKAYRQEGSLRALYQSIVHRFYPKRVLPQVPVTMALKGITLSVFERETVAVVGRSGSGKSTLLNIIAALTRPTEGTYRFAGREVLVKRPNDSDTIALRRRTGYISQASDLLQNFSVRQNIRLAARCRHADLSDREIDEWLDRVELDPKEMARRLPFELSGGERQRVNIVRALACNPLVVFADEPTGALDVHTGNVVLHLLVNLAKEKKTCLVLVTHNPEAAAMCGRLVCLANGRVIEDRGKTTEVQIRAFIRTGEIKA